MQTPRPSRTVEIERNETSRSSWGFATMEDFHEAVAKILASFPSYIVFPLLLRDPLSY